MFALILIIVVLLLEAAFSLSTPTYTRNHTLPEPGVCGVSLVDRIRGGNRTAIDAYPWTILLGYLVSSERIDFFCGGSLISDQFVLSAAHCLNPFDPDVRNVFVRLGEWDIESEMDCDGNICSDKIIDLYIKQYRLHENYDPEQTLNDIALIKLPRAVNFTDFIAPVCLPISENLKQQPKIGRTLTTIGWGETGHHKEGTFFYGSRYKKEVNIPVIDSETCGSLSYRALSSSEFCAENSSDSQSCKGDSGGPAGGAENDGYWYQHGIVSWGSQCGAKPAYGVYVRVSSFLPWIVETMDQLANAN